MSPLRQRLRNARPANSPRARGRRSQVDSPGAEPIAPDSAAAKNEQPWQTRTHLDNIKDAYKELIDANLKILGILLIVFGWFVSQPNPLPMICGIRQIAHFAVAATTFGIFGLAYLFDKIFRRGARAAQALDACGIDKLLDCGYRLSRPMYWIGLFGQFTLLLGIATVIYFEYIDRWGETCNITVKEALPPSPHAQHFGWARP